VIGIALQLPLASHHKVVTAKFTGGFFYLYSSGIANRQNFVSPAFQIAGIDFQDETEKHFNHVPSSFHPARRRSFFLNPGAGLKVHSDSGSSMLTPQLSKCFSDEDA
jgi:hypothetical protein